MSNTTLDLTAVWDDTMSLLGQHKEAAIAIGGVFLFLPGWLFAYFVGQPVLSGEEDPTQMIAVFQDFYSSNFGYILASGIVTVFGLLALYVTMVRDNIATIGGALQTTLGLFFVFFIANVMTNILTGIGFFLFFVPGLYVMGRFSTLPGVVAGEQGLGIIGSVKHAWAMTENVGWKAFLILFIVLVVGSIIGLVVGLIAGLLLGLIGGTTQLLLSAAISSLANSILSVVVAALSIAIYRHLKPQVNNAAAMSSEI